MRELICIGILFGLILIPNVVSATGSNGTLALNITLSNSIESSSIYASKPGITPPDTGIEKVEIVRLEGKRERAIHIAHFKINQSHSNRTTKKEIQLGPGTYILKVKYKGKKGKWILDGNGTGYEIKGGESVIVPLAQNGLDKDVLADMPWAARNGDLVPILLLVKDVNLLDFYPVYKAYIYDAGENINDTSDDIEKYAIDLNYDSTCLGTPVDKIDQDFWYRIVYVDPSLFTDHSGKIYIRVRYDAATLCWPSESDWDMDDEPMAVDISSSGLPTLVDWYAGDTHYHSSYTDNDIEFGYPIEATVKAGNAIGLDWITITDHSFDLDSTKFSNLGTECNTYSDSSFKCIRGEEISAYLGADPSCLPLPPQYNHYLAYGANFIAGGECADGTGSDYTPAQVVSMVNSQGGFGYPAHPMHEDAFRDPWQDYSLDFAGLQVWNYAQYIDSDQELLDGLDQWVAMLTEGRHVFIEGGSDSHGNFNDGLGKVRTIVYVPGYSQTDVPDQDKILDALKNGHSIMTDGPMVTFTINSAVIGDTTYVFGGTSPTLNIQWKSTSEFGEVTNIKIYRDDILVFDNSPSLLPISNGDGYSGSGSWTDPNPVTGQIYYRIEATSSLFPEPLTIYYAYTNPIWVVKGVAVDCTSCHDIGASASAPDIDVSAMDMHASIDVSQISGYEDDESCWACHGIVTQPSEYHSSGYTNPSYCSDCHVGTGKYSAPAVYEHIPTSGDLATSMACKDCHRKSVVASNDPEIPNDRSNISHYGTEDYLKVGSSQTSTKDCIGCHKESLSESEKWSATYLPDVGYIKMGTNAADTCWECHMYPPSQFKYTPDWTFHDAELWAPTWECANCHPEASASELVAPLQLAAQAEATPLPVHLLFDWEGDDANGTGPDDNAAESCIACHDNSDGYLYYTTPVKICEDCHLPNGTGPYIGPFSGEPFTEDNYILRADYNSSDVPIIYEHNTDTYSWTGSEINVTTQSDREGGASLSSCFGWNAATGRGTCHGIDHDQNEGAGGYYAHRNWTYDSYDFSDAYHYQVQTNFAANTTNCLFCHDQGDTTLAYAWGNATQIYDADSKHNPGNPECYLCHTEGQAAPTTFHIEELKMPPAITFLPPTPKNNSFVLHNWILINVSTLETLDTAILSWDLLGGIEEPENYTLTIAGNTAYKNMTGLTNGTTYVYRVYVSDSAGNTNVSEMRHTSIDATPPAITNVSHSPENPTKDDNITISAEVSDNNRIQSVVVNYTTDNWVTENTTQMTTTLIQSAGYSPSSFDEKTKGKDNKKVVVKYRKGGKPSKGHIHGLNGKEIRDIKEIDTEVIEVEDVAGFIQKIKKHPDVLSAQEAVVYQALITPSDPYYPQQWNLENINAEPGWNYSLGDNVTIAVIDTGVDYSHIDLDDNVILGYDWVNDDYDPVDDNGHGTHVAGIAAAEMNGIGVIGVALNSKILVEKVLDSDGLGHDYHVAEAIVHAAEFGVDVISLSLGGGYSSVIEDACNYAYGKGVLIVAAAGNNGGDILYPAALPTVIAVSSLNSDNTLSSFSSFGPEIELSAPGGGDRLIYSTYLDDSYKGLVGTSMAAPHVSGVAALIKSIHPEWTNEEIRNYLHLSATDIGNIGKDDLFGYGLVDAGKIGGEGTNVFQKEPKSTYSDGEVELTVSVLNTTTSNTNIQIFLRAKQTMINVHVRDTIINGISIKNIVADKGKVKLTEVSGGNDRGLDWKIGRMNSGETHRLIFDLSTKSCIDSGAYVEVRLDKEKYISGTTQALCLNQGTTVSLTRPISTYYADIGRFKEGTMIHYYIIADDEVGNRNSTIGDIKSVFVIDPSPTITINSPNNTTYATNSVDLNYSVYGLTKVDWVAYSLDGLANVTTSGEVTMFSNSTGGDLGTATNVTFTSSGSDTYVYLKILKNATTISASMNVVGFCQTDSCDWQPDGVINSSLGDVGGGSDPTVFQKDGTWYLISGTSRGKFYGYNWTGDAWQPDSKINSSLGGFGDWSAPTVFQKDGTWYLIAGEYWWEDSFYGYNWTGSIWQPDSKIISGLKDVGYMAAPTVFEKDNTWYLITGKFNGTFDGYNWTDSAWQPDSKINSSLGDAGAMTVPTVFNKHATWFLITGKSDGTFDGYNWAGNTWQPDSEIISGLGEVNSGSNSAPAVFQKDGTWYLIAGGYDGTFNGYSLSSVPTNLSLSVNNTLIWNMIGELSLTNSPQQITNMTAVLNNEIAECDTPDPNDSNYCLIRLNFTSATAGIVQLDALSVGYYSSTTLTNLSKGQHNVTVYANDTAGNINSSTVYFTVDTTPQNSTFNISLNANWNLISIPLEQSNWSLTSVLSSIDGKYNVVFAYIDGGWKRSTAPRSALTDMSLQYGYWINMTESATLELSGTVPSVTTMNVNIDWNLMGYPSLTAQNLTTVLSPISYTVVFEYRNGGWKRSTAPRSPLTDMSPGYGYWVNVTEDGSYEVSD